MKGDINNPIQLDEVVVTAGATHVSQMGIDLITHFEGFKLEAYQDSVGIWTLGFGSTFFADGRKVKMGDKVTKDEAISLFRTVLLKFEQTVLQKVKRPLKQNEFDALVSFTYNCGGSYKSANVWKDYDIYKNAQNNMPLVDMAKYWESAAVTAGGQKLNGLVRRRKSEAHLYSTGELNFY